MKGMLKVEGHPTLRKNPVTGVLVNVDEDGYKAVKKRRDYTKNIETENSELKSRLEALEQKVMENIGNG